WGEKRPRASRAASTAPPSRSPSSPRSRSSSSCHRSAISSRAPTSPSRPRRRRSSWRAVARRRSLPPCCSPPSSSPLRSFALDIGRCPDGADKLSTLLLTHAHIDHASGLAYYVAMRDLVGATVPRVFAPEESVAPLRDILAAWHRLQGATECEITPVRPGDE